MRRSCMKDLLRHLATLPAQAILDPGVFSLRFSAELHLPLSNAVKEIESFLCMPGHGQVN